MIVRPTIQGERLSQSVSDDETFNRKLVASPARSNTIVHTISTSSFTPILTTSNETTAPLTKRLNNPPSSKMATGFFSLPPEIRQQIYLECLVDAWSVLELREGLPPNDPSHNSESDEASNPGLIPNCVPYTIDYHINISILLTCRAIYGEAAPILNRLYTEGVSYYV